MLRSHCVPTPDERVHMLTMKYEAERILKEFS